MTEINVWRNSHLKILDSKNVTPLVKTDDKIFLAVYENKRTGGTLLASTYGFSIIFGVHVAPEGKYHPKTNPGTKDYRILDLIKNAVKYKRAKDIEIIKAQLESIK